MTDVRLIYNPYFLKVDLFIENIAVTSNSPLAFIFGKTMDKWLKQSGSWRGLFAELVEAVGDNRLNISFIGTPEDFDDLNLATRPENIELIYPLSGNSKIRARPRQKLQDLVDFLSVPIFVDDKDFLADVRPAIKEISSDKLHVNVVSIVQNFSVRKILPKAVDSPKLNFVMHNSNQNLMLTLLKVFAELNMSITLFVFDSKTISSQTVSNTLRKVTQAIGHDEYARAIYESLFFVCTDGTNIKNVLNTCGFSRPKIFMFNDLVLEQTILTYADRYALTDTVRKIYLVTKKNLAIAENDVVRKISDATDSLQRLRNRITDLTRNFTQQNQHTDSFDMSSIVIFDNAKFDDLSRELLNKLNSIELPAVKNAVDKNLVGDTKSYIKLADADSYSQDVNSCLKKTLGTLVDEVTTYLKDNLLTPANDAAAERNLTASFEQILSDKNFVMPTVNLDPLTFESYEATGRRYAFVKYISVEEFLSEYQTQTERLLKERLRKLKTAAIKFANDFRAQAMKNFNRPTPQVVDNSELQGLQRAVDSKTKRLASYKNELDALKNFGKQLDNLLEINP